MREVEYIEYLETLVVSMGETGNDEKDISVALLEIASQRKKRQEKKERKEREIIDNRAEIHNILQRMWGKEREKEERELEDIEVTLVCGHLKKIHRCSSTFDFPDDPIHCPECGESKLIEKSHRDEINRVRKEEWEAFAKENNIPIGIGERL